MQSSLWQSKEWGEFQKSLPGRGAYWLLTHMEKGHAAGRALVVRQGLPFGLCWLSIARGPVFAEGVDADEAWKALWAEIRKLAKRERAVFVRVELPCDSPLRLEGAKGWRTAHAHYYPEWTRMVDLKPSLDAILAQMKPKGRYNIKVAQKNGVTVRATHRSEDVAAFYKILQETGGRDAFGIHSEAYYQALVKAGHTGGWGTLYVAEVSGENGRDEMAIVSGIFVTSYGNTATYYYGASAHGYRSMMAPYLLQWEAIQEAKRQGCDWYDFLGVAPEGNGENHPWSGITEFKEKFGGIRIKYPEAKEFVASRGWYAILRVAKFWRSF